MSMQVNPEPLPFIRRWVEALDVHYMAGGVLDLACGSGRHGRAFLEKGWPVTFLDRDITGVMDLAGAPGATVMAADLETDGPWPLAGQRFDLLVVTNYLYRARFADIFELVAPGGMLLYETFMAGNEAYGRPTNPDFLLQSGELKDRLPIDFEILQFEEGLTGDPADAVKQRIAARRRPAVFERSKDGYTVSDDPARLDVAVMHGYLASSYWYRGLAEATAARAAKHSLSFGLYDPNGAQIGFARMVTDRTTFAYLADVFILEQAQGQGLGTFLMEALMTHPDLQGLKRHMLVTRDAHGLYEKFGFVAVEPEDAPRIMVKEDMEFHLKRRD
ncbi:GNAT family N-acetyltransferase [Aestuariispira insulae]|uniref:Acetyltransferase (GNAT) family protein n=1 Tax=Aestuariispira insulae TaxID=1461337 RepID=A0A3D9HDV2_9PROT|nr:GNAT family N-acetyltransferase [Aestuariispira insulae]RED47654.1 acetyltransferase (GNAT) family protein [Aestuariispira insulae]